MGVTGDNAAEGSAAEGAGDMLVGEVTERVERLRERAVDVAGLVCCCCCCWGHLLLLLLVVFSEDADEVGGGWDWGVGCW
jgi:hypothetical protein